MANNGKLSHVVVTPSRNETDFFPALLESMTKQSILPSEWIIVSHNSGEAAKEFLNQASKKHDWISVVSVDDGSKRKRGSQIAKLVNTGLSQTSLNWDFFSKIDADMILPRDYFADIFSKFSNSESLGIASGTCFILSNKSKEIEKTSPDHTRGGLKTYRRECYEEIGGIKEINGWDGVDNILAQMNGWETTSFLDLEVQHQRRTGSHSGLIVGCFESGRFAHSMGYFPPFMVARSLHRMASKPIFFGGISMFMGYLYSVLTRQKRSTEPEVAAFLRKKQKERLKLS